LANPTLQPREGQLVPQVDFRLRQDGEWKTVSSDELFAGRNVVVFSLPGAFTPTCSTYQLPGFEKNADAFRDLGVDEIYCMSVNDSFVMNKWAQGQNLENVKVIPDGSGEFTRRIGMLVDKANLGFGPRSWRYAAVVNDGVIEAWFEEPGRCDNHAEDPYGESSPETVLAYLKKKAA
jgi:peroxiredoxin